jgi:hypothetical protein
MDWLGRGFGVAFLAKPRVDSGSPSPFSGFAVAGLGCGGSVFVARIGACWPAGQAGARNYRRLLASRAVGERPPAAEIFCRQHTSAPEIDIAQRLFSATTGHRSAGYFGLIKDLAVTARNTPSEVRRS